MRHSILEEIQAVFLRAMEVGPALDIVDAGVVLVVGGAAASAAGRGVLWGSVLTRILLLDLLEGPGELTSKLVIILIGAIIG